MTDSFDALMERIEVDRAEALREVADRFAIAEALMNRVYPDQPFSGKDHAEVLFEFFERIDEVLDAIDDDDDDDDDD